MSKFKAWFKSRLILILIIAVWGALLLLTWRGWYQILITLLSIPFKKLGDYTYSLWMSQDQDVKVIIKGGNPDITISSYVGYMQEQGSKTAAAAASVIDLMFKIVRNQDNHCIASIERDEIH